MYLRISKILWKNKIHVYRKITVISGNQYFFGTYSSYTCSTMFQICFCWRKQNYFRAFTGTGSNSLSIDCLSFIFSRYWRRSRCPWWSFSTGQEVIHWFCSNSVYCHTCMYKILSKRSLILCFRIFIPKVGFINESNIAEDTNPGFERYFLLLYYSVAK